MAVVSLTDHDRRFAALIGAKRHRPASVVTLADDTLGAAAELAVARYLGLSWLAYRPDSGSIPADVGANVQVRATGRPDGSLLLHRRDPAAHAYVLAHVEDAQVELLGWEWGYRLKLPTYWRDGFHGRPCYVVGREALRSMEGLAMRVERAA